MNSYKINSGDLNKRIIIQKLTATKDENGFPLESWDNYKTLWSNVCNLSGREYFNAMAVQMENTVKFSIRYFKDLDSTINLEGKDTTKVYRIQYNKSFYNINFIDDVKMEHKFMEIKALSEVV